MIVLTDKIRDLCRFEKLPAQLSEFEVFVNLKNHKPFEVLFSGIARKNVHYILSRAQNSDGEVYVVFDSAVKVPWWVRSYAKSLDFEAVIPLERVNKLKGLLEGSLNYVDLLFYVLEVPIEELVYNCADMGICSRAVTMRYGEKLRRQFIMCDVLERYLSQREELSL